MRRAARIGCLLLAASAAQAQPLPPYEAKLERLAELLGTLSFMQDLCKPGEGEPWRAKMTDLLNAEGTTAERRDRLAGAFDHGHDGYGAYRHCTPSAELVIERSLAEGSRLARELASRFGG